MCEPDRHLARLEQSLEDWRKELAAERRSIPRKVSERVYAANAFGIDIPPQSRNLVEITGILLYCTSYAVLTLGNRQIPVSTGTYVWNLGRNGILLAETDVRNFTQQFIGQISAELLGEEKGDSLSW